MTRISFLLIALLWLIAIVALLAIQPAEAGTDKSTGETCRGSTCNGTTIDQTATGYTVNVYHRGGAEADSHAGSASNSSSSAAGGDGGHSSVVVNNAGGSGTTGSNSRRVEVRSIGIAPDLGGNNTAPCRVSIGAGGGWLGGALSIQGSVLDEGCDVWRDNENLRKAGFDAAANARLCDKPEISRYLTHCEPQPQAEPATTWRH